MRARRASWGACAPEEDKKPAASYSRAGGSRTTLGEEALDFRVRDGNGYGRLSVATGESRSLELKRTATLERRIASLE